MNETITIQKRPIIKIALVCLLIGFSGGLFTYYKIQPNKVVTIEKIIVNPTPDQIKPKDIIIHEKEYIYVQGEIQTPLKPGEYKFPVDGSVDIVYKDQDGNIVGTGKYPINGNTVVVLTDNSIKATTILNSDVTLDVRVKTVKLAPKVYYIGGYISTSGSQIFAEYDYYLWQSKIDGVIFGRVEIGTDSNIGIGFKLNF
jgi:hypothetical protein